LSQQTKKLKKSRLKNYLHLWRKHPFLSALRLILLGAFLVGALLAGIYYTYRNEIKIAFSHWVENQTHYLFAPEVSFSLMETAALGYFIFHDFRITDPFDKSIKLLEAKRVEVQFDPLYLFWRGITLSRLEIHGASFYIHKDPGSGSINLGKIFKSRGGSSGLASRVRIRDFLLKDCRVHLEDIDEQPIENEISHLEGSFTRIAGENLVELFASEINTTYWSAGRIELSGIFPINGDYLGFRNIHFVKGRTDLASEGFVDFSNHTFQYKIKPGSLELAHLPPELGMREHLQGIAEVSANFQGRFDSTAVDSRVRMTEGVIFGYPVSDFSCDLHYTAGRLSFENLKAEVCEGKVKSGLEFLFGSAGEGYVIRIEAERIRADQLKIPRLKNLNGLLSGRLRLQGSGYDLGDLALAGTVSSLRGKLYGIPIDSSSASFSYKDSKVRIDKLAVYSQGAQATAIGDVNGSELFMFVMIEKLPVQRLSGFLPLENLMGTCDFSGSLSGDLFDPQLKGDFSMAPGSWRELQFERLEGTCELSHLMDRIEGTVGLSLGDVEFSGRHFETLKLAAAIPDSGMVRFSQFYLVEDSLNNLFASGYYFHNPETGARQFQVDTLDLLYSGERLTASDSLKFNICADTIAVPAMRLHTLAGQVEGAFSVAGNREIEADLTFTGIDLSRIPAIFDLDLSAGGNLDGQLRLQGSLSDPICTLEARIDQVLFSILSVEKANVKAVLAGGELRIDRLELTDSSSTSLITGKIPLDFPPGEKGQQPAPDKTFSLEASLSRFPISSVKSDVIPLTEGLLDGRLVITGTRDKPVVRGEVLLAEGEGLIAPINTRLKNLSGKISFEPGVIILSDFGSASPEGKINLSGRIPLDGFKPDSLDLKIIGRQLVFQQFKYVTHLNLEVDLTAQGPISNLFLSGNVRVLSGEINPLIGSVQVADQNLTQNSVVQLPLSPINYDLTFSAAENFWLRNRNASIKLTANLRATQRDTTPQINGEITTIAGFYSMYGRRFRIRYGTIQFQGQANLNPLLNINAERTVRGKVLLTNFVGSASAFRGTSGPIIPGEQYEMDRNTFYLHIGGTLNTPLFTITIKDRENRDIEPPITEEQARTLVIFDQTYREFQQQSSLSQSKLLDQAANMALNQANPYLQDITGLDEFSFESQLFNRGSSEDRDNERASAKITMGEFLFESVFFSFSQDLIDPTARSAEIEYLINRNSSIISQTDSRGHFSVDFRYRIKY